MFSAYLHSVLSVVVSSLMAITILFLVYLISSFSLAKCCFFIYWDDHVRVFLLIWFNIYWLWMLNHPCIPEIYSTWLQCVIFLVECWIVNVSILLGIFASIFTKNMNLCFCDVSSFVSCIRWSLASWKESDISSFSTCWLSWDALELLLLPMLCETPW